MKYIKLFLLYYFACKAVGNKKVNLRKQAMIFVQLEIKHRWDNDYQFRTNPNVKFFDLKPVENYKMTFYGDGKLAYLEKVSSGKSALWGGLSVKVKNRQLQLTC